MAELCALPTSCVVNTLPGAPSMSGLVASVPKQ